MAVTVGMDERGNPFFKVALGDKVSDNITIHIRDAVEDNNWALITFNNKKGKAIGGIMVALDRLA